MGETGEATRWRRMESWSERNFDALNRWGSVAVVALLAVLLTAYA